MIWWMTPLPLLVAQHDAQPHEPRRSGERRHPPDHLPTLARRGRLVQGQARRIQEGSARAS
jgi:hypothetical protein